MDEELEFQHTIAEIPPVIEAWPQDSKGPASSSSMRTISEGAFIAPLRPNSYYESVGGRGCDVIYENVNAACYVNMSGGVLDGAPATDSSHGTSDA